MAPKKKAQKMALADFFAEDSGGGSWADEMDNLPTAPAPKDPNSGPQRGEPGYLDAMPDRGARAFTGPPREELPLPTSPPFTAFVGNLSFETDEETIKAHFGDCTAVRLMKDPQGTPKGFGYVEFASQAALKSALERNSSSLGGRTIRVTVAEAPSQRRDFTPSAADEASQWRRSGPLPARDPPPQARRQGSFGDIQRGGGEERDWSSARGARFVPSVAPAPSGLRRDSSGPGREREPSAADDAGQWRSSKPLVEVREGQGQQRGDRSLASGQSSPSMADTEQTWSRGTKLRTPVTSEPAASGAASPAEDRDWRSSRATSAVPSTDGGDSPRQPAAPVERRKLNLAPRSASTTAPSESTTTSSSIFGAAKPADTAAREREAAAKLAARDAERKKAREEEFQKEAERGKKLAEDKARSIREAQLRAEAEVAGKKYVPAPTAGGKDKKRPERKVSEDGFEVARGAGSAKNASARPAPKKEISTTRTGFSFANAASGGFAAESEGAEGDDEAVEEVTSGVEGVKV